MPATHLQAPPTASAAWIKFIRIGIILAFSAGLVAYAVLSRKWPLVWDMQVTHYVSFLVDHGWSPYRQTWDMNMPGAYLVEGWALHLFGSSDFGWRLYDFSLSAVLLGSMIAIARRYDWLAGLVAASTFILAHAAEGPINAGQREQEIATLLVLGACLCIEAVRQRRAWLMYPFGLATAIAVSIKPTQVLVGPVMLVLVLIHLHREKVRSLAYTLWTLAGFATATGIVLHFLLFRNSMPAFLFDLTRIIPNYATVNQVTWFFLIKNTLPLMTFVYVGIAVILALLDRNLFNWEISVVLVGLFFGIANFYAQRKGFGPHRYTAMCFALLWASLQIFASFRSRLRSARLLAYAALALVVLVGIPRHLTKIRKELPYDDISHYLEQDLQRIGTEPMQHKIQCLDVVDGCLTALYHLQLIQTNGATGDLLLFLRTPSWAVQWARDQYWQSIQQNPPTVFVLTNREFEIERSFNKIDRWPLFAQYLRENYVLVDQREFATVPPTSNPGTNPDVMAYRIYIRKGSPLLSAAQRSAFPDH